MSIKQSVEWYTSNTDDRTLGDYKEDNLVAKREEQGGIVWLFLSTYLLPDIFKNDVLLL